MDKAQPLPQHAAEVSIDVVAVHHLTMTEARSVGSAGLVLGTSRAQGLHYIGTNLTRARVGTRHYLVNAHHPELARHETTQSLLRQLFPLATCKGDDLQAKLDQITEHAFIAGELVAGILRLTETL